MRNIFKPRRPAHRAELAPIAIQDLLVARWWEKLPAPVKVDKREQVVWAQFGVTK
jgi:hypothetical protein